MRACTLSSHEITVNVQDTGIGIPPAKLPLLFQEFSQVDTSTTRMFGGTGLGLAISKQLVELMNGSIGCTSNPGKGSTFWFTLPLALDSTCSDRSVFPQVLHDFRVLIVDDHPVSKRVIRDQINGWAMRNDTVESGEEALTLLRSAAEKGDHYHAVLTDYQMTGMSGSELATQIKAEISLRAPIVVVLSPAGCLNRLRSVKNDAIDAVLVKPPRASQLLDALVTAAAHRGGTAAAPYSPAPQQDLQDDVPGVEKVRVLLAEDNIVNQKVAASMLQRLGIRIDVVANGIEAVRQHALLPYDIILMDCQMPEMDGYEAARHIRNNEQGERRVTIIAMTAEALSGTRERCLEAGMDDYITKPVSLNTLREALNKRYPAATEYAVEPWGETGR